MVSPDCTCGGGRRVSPKYRRTAVTATDSRTADPFLTSSGERGRDKRGRVDPSGHCSCPHPAPTAEASVVPRHTREVVPIGHHRVASRCPCKDCQKAAQARRGVETRRRSLPLRWVPTVTSHRGRRNTRITGITDSKKHSRPARLRTSSSHTSLADRSGERRLP